jgi:hypothetical protein
MPLGHSHRRSNRTPWDYRGTMRSRRCALKPLLDRPSIRRTKALGASGDGQGTDYEPEGRLTRHRPAGKRPACAARTLRHRRAGSTRPSVQP